MNWEREKILEIENSLWNQTSNNPLLLLEWFFIFKVKIKMSTQDLLIILETVNHQPTFSLNFLNFHELTDWFLLS